MAQRRHFWDVLVASFTLAASVLFFVDSLSLPPPKYDPLGASMFPRAIGLILGALALGVLVGGVRGTGGGPAGESPEGGAGRPVLTVLVIGAAVLYTWVLASGAVPYNLATLGFFTVIAAVFRGGALRALTFVAIGIVLGFGGQWLLTRVLFVDLPT